MSEILKADFSNARVGDRVKCLYRGGGEIQKVSDDESQTNHKIKVSFDNLAGYIWYSVTGCDGSFTDGEIAINTLFYELNTQLPKIEVDEKIWVWDCIAKDFLPMHFYRFVEGGINVWEYGKTSFTTSNSSHCYKYWKLASDETINSGNLDEIEDENE